MNTNTRDSLMNAIYTNPDMMRNWLDSAETVRQRFIRVRKSLAIAKNPQFRYQLETVPTETVRVCEAVLLGCQQEIAPLRNYIIRSVKDGLAMDEIWTKCPMMELGFSHGDSVLLCIR